jgi:SAM-dependent methyltransferase
MPDGAHGSVSIERLDRCPHCNSDDTVEWAHARDRLLRLSPQTFIYSRCKACGILFQSERPAEASIAHFYPDEYAPYAGANASSCRWGRANNVALWASNRLIGVDQFERQMDGFYAALSAKPVVLDFGCGSGKFLEKARAKGCETIGMDFSPIALAHVAERGHRALSITDSDWQSIAHGSVGLVRMNHVVEHLYDPRRILSLLARKLAPGGIIHIATPNSDSVSAEDYREYWFSLDCPRHIMIFTPRSLTALVREAGFQDIELLHEPLTKDMARSELYRQVDASLTPESDIASAHADGLLALQFTLRSRRAVRQRRSDRIHLLARKS